MIGNDKKAKTKLKEIGSLSLTMCTSDNNNHDVARKINKLAREVYNMFDRGEPDPE